MTTKYGRVLHEKSFLLFCYPGKIRRQLPLASLTKKQATVYNCLKSGLTRRAASVETGMTFAAIHSHVCYIKKKGWTV